MRGVILAGGKARRLRPLSIDSNKHLLPVYDRPLVCYPLRTLVRAGVRDIAVVTNVDHVSLFLEALGAGSRFGCRLRYFAQDGKPGTGAALLAAREFVGDRRFAVILGDNIFTEDVGPELRQFQAGASHGDRRAKVFVRQVKDPKRYGVAVFEGGRIVNVVEKPDVPPGDCIVTGLWAFSPSVFERAARLEISARGEYEMTDVLASYAREGLLAHAFVTSRWMDVGTFESLAEARAFFRLKGIATAWLESRAPGAALNTRSRSGLSDQPS